MFRWKLGGVFIFVSYVRGTPSPDVNNQISVQKNKKRARARERERESKVISSSSFVFLIHLLDGILLFMYTYTKSNK